MFHVFAILIAEFFYQLRFFFWRTDCHQYECEYSQRGDEPGVCDHAECNEHGGAERIQRMPNPAIRPGGDELGGSRVALVGVMPLPILLNSQ